MQSLRTRKPSEARSRGQKSGGNKLAKSGEGAVARRATRVDDKIKKRMSMRYADISSPTNVSVPPLPTIPLALRPGLGPGTSGKRDATDYAYTGERDEGERGERVGKEETREADLRMLDQDKFDPDACEWCIS